MSLRGPDISIDMRVLKVLGETADSGISESMVVGYSNPLT
jgi:hypothetical protein